MTLENFSIRKAHPNEFKPIGQLMVEVYSSIKGFPKKEHSTYFEFLKNIGTITMYDSVELLVVVSSTNEIAGAVVFFKTMDQYGTGGIATQEKNASGFRLLAVASKFRGIGLGKHLCEICIEKAKDLKKDQVIIHSTASMEVARNMYKKMGFQYSQALDFKVEKLDVFGFRLYF